MFESISSEKCVDYSRSISTLADNTKMLVLVGLLRTQDGFFSMLHAQKCGLRVYAITPLTWVSDIQQVPALCSCIKFFSIGELKDLGSIDRLSSLAVSLEASFQEAKDGIEPGSGQSGDGLNFLTFRSNEQHLLTKPWIDQVCCPDGIS